MRVGNSDDDDDDDGAEYSIDGRLPGQPEFAPGFSDPENIVRERRNGDAWAARGLAHAKVAAAAGSADAQFALGSALPAPEGMPWLLKAVAAGHALAAVTAACYAVDGRSSGVPSDSEGLRLFTIAAERGSAYARWTVGLAFDLKGKRREAERHFRLAAALASRPPSIVLRK